MKTISVGKITEGSGSVAIAEQVDYRRAAVYQYFPTVTPDERTIYFASNRTDLGNVAGVDIFAAQRPSAGAPFGTPVNVYELNTWDDDYPNWISADGCTPYTHRRTTAEAYVWQKIAAVNRGPPCGVGIGCPGRESVRPGVAFPDRTDERHP